VRAFTHGYDLFHPHRLIAWHEYTRKGRTKHWEDHSDWPAWNAACHAQNRQLFGMDEYAHKPVEVETVQRGPYGFGSARSLEDYERYAGICFRRRAFTQAALDSLEPGPGDNRDVPYEEFAASCIPLYRHCIDLHTDRLPLDDYDLWCVAFKDEHGNDVNTHEADAAEIAQIQKEDGWYRLWRQFETDIQPKSWIVWPRSAEHGWLPPVMGHLG
jgi:hypothetical protein